MDFIKFKQVINEKIKASGEALLMVFSHDAEKGQFRAESEDIVFTAPQGGKSITALWGSGHQARFSI